MASWCAARSASVKANPSSAATLRSCSSGGTLIVLSDITFPTRLPAQRSQLLMKPRHDLFTQQPHRGHDLRVRNQAAGIQLGQDTVDAELLLQSTQPLADALGRADQHLN